MKRQYRWTIASTFDQQIVTQLSKDINVSETIGKILFQRDITTYDQAKVFFRPQLSDLHDPLLMDNMSKAVERVIISIEKKEKILIFSDYDVDGTNGAAMLFMFLKKYGVETIIHIPDRIKEGYGISKFGIDRGKEFGASLFIAVDCGITAIDQVEYARSLGIDVIICDHHEPLEIIPNAVAVLDPLKPDCQYPSKYLCGCGVAFKLIQAVARHLNEEEAAFEYLDFVSLATSADIVPLIGENRILTKIGLQYINDKPRAGIKALIQSSGTQLGKISTGQIVFVLAPRINAVGRLGDALRAVKLLTSDDELETLHMAQELEDENRNRRKIDEDTFLKAQELVEILLQGDNDPAIVLHHEQWHPGVIGIVASRLVEKYYRPTIMMTTIDGVAKGSARSIVGFDIHKALKRVEDKLIQFGGHKYAAGLAVQLDRIDEFRNAFNQVVEELLSEELKTPEIKIDAEINLDELTPRFLKILKEFAPFGPGNMRPVFLARNIEVVGIPKIVGKDHLRFKVKQNKHAIDTIGFGLGNLLDEVHNNGSGIDIVFTVDEHEWPSQTNHTSSNNPSGEAFLQLKLKDVRKSSQNPVDQNMSKDIK